MITVVVSTRSINNKFVDMVKKTSGIKDIEILIYENNGEMSLTQVYNKGLNESKNNIVVFMHDDVKILTKDWGKNLIRHYEKSDYGILGVAGTKLLTENGIWWAARESMYGSVTHTDGEKTWKSDYSYDFGNEIKNVVVVDGVFMSCMKDRIKKQFNEEYDNFHFYDITFSFDNFKEGVKVGVHFDIRIIHSSIGETNDKWEENRAKFIANESKNLPKTSVIEVPYIDSKIMVKNQKKLAIIIPTKNNVDELLIPCVKSIINKSTYGYYQIYIADTGSKTDELNKTKKFIEDMNIVMRRGKIELIEYDYYNFAKINNDVVKNKIDADTELLLFCNNDIEMVNDAISIMVNTYNENNKVGTVGGRLHYEDGSIQHLGISLQVNSKNNLSITHKYLKWDYENIRASKSESYTHGNTAAFMLVAKDLFLEIGGFNEEYIECFEDVEFNLQCILKNKINITTSKAVCYHLESQTRDRNGESIDLQMILKFINNNPNIIKSFNKID